MSSSYVLASVFQNSEEKAKAQLEETYAAHRHWEPIQLLLTKYKAHLLLRDVDFGEFALEFINFIVTSDLHIWMAL